VGKPKGRRALGKLRLRRKNNIKMASKLKWVFEKWDLGAWTGSIWLRIGTGGGLL
jgi:hypothetical protein